MIYKSRIFDSAIKNIIDPVIQRNGYFANPENILLTMITDERQHVRELALRRVMKFKINSTSNEIRIFNVPAINFDAEDYTELINWQIPNLTAPPLLKNLSCEDLKDIIRNVPKIVNILSFPYHSQAVERCVKLVTEASSSVCGDDARDGFIRTRIASRATLSKFDTKSDFQHSLN